MMHPSLQSWPREMSDAFFRPGKTCVLVAVGEREVIGRFPLWVAVRLLLSGR